MILKKILLFNLFFLASINIASANSQVRSNHSYKNMGFTQTPIVTIGGFSDFKAIKTSQEKIFGDKYLPDNKKITPELGTVNTNNDDLDFNNQTNISIKIDAINDLGVKYGGIIELEGVFNTSNRESVLSMNKSYIYAESIFGKFEFGNNHGVAEKMKVGAETIARGAGGIGGDYINYINLPMILHPDYYENPYVSGSTGTGSDDDYLEQKGKYLNVKLPRFILIPQHPMSHSGTGIGYNNYVFNCDLDGNGRTDSAEEKACIEKRKELTLKSTLEEFSTATKFSYFSPSIYGFQIGASFAPNAMNRGPSTARFGKTYDEITNIIEYGVTYTNTFGNMGLAISYTAQKGESNYIIRKTNTLETLRNDISSYEIGANITYFGLTLAGSYGNWGNSSYELSGIYSYAYDKNSLIYNNSGVKFDDAKYYTAGLAYEFGPYNFSATYFKSSFQNNDYKATSIGVDYKLGKGIIPYIEYTMFEFESAQPNISEIRDPQVGSALKVLSDVIKDNKGGVLLIGVMLKF